MTRRFKVDSSPPEQLIVNARSKQTALAVPPSWLRHTAPAVPLSRVEGGYSVRRQERADLGLTRVVMNDDIAPYVRLFADEVEGIIEGYLLIFGDEEHVDWYGTFFDKDNPPILGLDDKKRIRLMYEHSFDGKIQSEIIGYIENPSKDIFPTPIGIRYRAQLDTSSQFYARIVEEVTLGKLYTSSGSDHTAVIDMNGMIREWYLSEVSLTSDPAEPNMPRVTVRAEPDEPIGKSTMFRALEELFADGAEPTLEQITDALIAKYGLDDVTAMIAMADTEDPDVTLLSFTQQVDAMLRARADQADRDADRADRASLRTQLTDMQQQLTDLATRAHSEPPTEPPTEPLPDTPPTRTNGMQDLAFAHLTAADMLFGYQVLSSGTRFETPNSDSDFYRAMIGKFDDAVRTTNHPFAHPTTLRHLPFRANEIMQSDLSGFGDEWVGTMYGTDLWEVARVDTMWDVLTTKGAQQIEITRGESFTVLLEGSDPTWYSGAQAADHTSGEPDVTAQASQVATGQKVITTGIAKARVDFSDELEEDSLIPLLPQLRRQIEISAQETIEYIILNGDTVTTANTNINLIDGTPASGLTAPVYLVSDGIIKDALTNGRDGGALTIADYRLTIGQLSAAQQAKQGNNLFVMDNSTHNTSLGITEIATEDVRRTNATIESGMILNVYGVDTFISGQMALANSAGKISATPANNTLGRLVIVHCPHWALGWKRRVRTEVERSAIRGTTSIVTSFRLGVTERAAASSGVSYNLTIA